MNVGVLSLSVVYWNIYTLAGNADHVYNKEVATKVL